MRKYFYISVVLSLTSTSCAWTEPTRVEADFGNSVRLMVAEQLYDPATARDPLVDAPEVLSGAAAQAAIDGQAAAAREARLQRVRTTGSPIPTVGVVSDVEGE